MKGSANVEFILSVVLFVIVIAFVSMSIIGIQPRLKQEVMLDSIRSEAVRLSDRIVMHEIGSKAYVADDANAFFDRCIASPAQFSAYKFEIEMNNKKCSLGQFAEQRPRFTVVRNVLLGNVITPLKVTVSI